MKQNEYIIRVIEVNLFIILIGIGVYFFQGFLEKPGLEEELEIILQNSRVYELLDSISVLRMNQDNSIGQRNLSATDIKRVKMVKDSLNNILTKSGPVYVIGAFGYEILNPRRDAQNRDSKQNRSDTVADISYWNRNFAPIDLIALNDSAFSHFDTTYVHIIPVGNTRAHKIVTTRVQEFDENIYLFSVNVIAQFNEVNFFKDKFGSTPRMINCRLIVYYPGYIQPALGTNLLVLLIYFFILSITYRRHPILNKKFHKYFLIAIFFMIVQFASLFLPYLTSALFPTARFVAVLFQFMPDAAMFYVAGFYLFYDAKIVATKTVISLIIIQFLTLSRYLWYIVPIFLGSGSMLFIPFRQIELIPTVFGAGALVFIAFGIPRQCRPYLEELKGNFPSGLYIWLIILFASMFFWWGILQPFFSIWPTQTFYIIILLAKSLALGSIIIIGSMFTVLNNFAAQRKIAEQQKTLIEQRTRLAKESAEKAEEQRILAETVISVSPEALIVFNNLGEIKWISKAGVEQLIVNPIDANNIKELLSNQDEVDFLMSLNKSGLERKDFLLSFKDRNGELIDYVVSNVPIKNANLQLITMRMLNTAVLYEVAGSIQFHEKRGNLLTARYNFESLLKIVKENYHYDEIENDPKTINVREYLTDVINYLKDTDNCYKERMRINNVSNLSAVIKKIKLLSSNKEFEYIRINALLSEDIPSNLYVRHDENILLNDIKEVLTNANKKFAKTKIVGNLNITIKFEKCNATVDIIIRDDGAPYPDAAIEQLRDTSRLLISPRMHGLESIKRNMRILGGDMTIDNEEKDNKLTPILTFTLWKARKNLDV